MEELIFRNIRFTQRPIPIPVDYRPVYKIAQIVLILKLCCRDEKASLVKLHLFIWALKSEKNMEQVSSSVKSNFKNKIDVWGMEPALNRALEFSIAEGICSIVDGKFKLIDKGLTFFDKIIKEQGILEKEVAFLKSIKKGFSEEQVQKIIDKWEVRNAKN